MPTTQNNIQKIQLYALYILIITAILVIISYFYFDNSLYNLFADYHFRQYKILKFIIHIPEVLVIAALVTLLCIVLNFVDYPYFTPLKLKLFALSVGLLTGFAIKDLLKYAFSRVGLAFFYGQNAYGSFPSGHTTLPFVAAAFLWYWQPCIRSIVFIIPLLVAGALLITNSHYLGDIIGGVGLGVILGSYAYYFSEVGRMGSGSKC